MAVQPPAPMDGYLVDTSVFVAAEQRRLTDSSRPPAGETRISVATLTELGLGVRVSTGAARELRERTLAAARLFIPLAYDEPVAERLAGLLAGLRAAGRRVGVMDAIIAATALAHELTVWSLDGDFATLAEIEPELSLLAPEG